MTGEQRAIIATAVGTLRTASAFLADKDRDYASNELMVVARQLEELIDREAPATTATETATAPG